MVNQRLLALASNIKDMLLDLVVLEKTPRHDSQANLAEHTMLSNTRAEKAACIYCCPHGLCMFKAFCIVFLLSLVMFFMEGEGEGGERFSKTTCFYVVDVF